MSEPLTVALERLLAELAERVARRVVELQAAGRASGEPCEGSPWLSVESAAAYLDWPKQRLYKLSAAGAIPHYKQEGRLLFKRQELDRWLAGFACGRGDWIDPGQAS